MKYLVQLPARRAYSPEGRPGLSFTIDNGILECLKEEMSASLEENANNEP